jgi:ketosteroid isomerase-like protein
MDDDRAFLEWFRTTWKDAEDALHDGDAAPRFETWSDRPPVTLFGAGWNAQTPEEARAVFRHLGEGFSDIEECEVELVTHDVSGDFAYTVHREHTRTRLDGEPRDYTLRVTQVYRREEGVWKVVHRHGDNEASVRAP